MEQTQEQDAEPETAREIDAELPEDGDGARDFIRGVGRQFQVARVRTGMTQEQAAVRLRYGVDLISSVERGRRTPQPELLAAADELFNAGGLLMAVVQDLENARTKARVRHPAWYRRVAAIEARSVEIHSYTTTVIPGLLQTEAHARAAHRARRPPLDEETIEKRVADRLDRQKILTAWPPPHASFVIEACEEHPNLEGPFTLLTPKGKPQVAYVESHGHPHLITDAEQVRLMAARYGSIRAHALTPRASMALIERLMEEL
jgi:transcriptional regulator with XRE-family HTH domain